MLGCNDFSDMCHWYSNHKYFRWLSYFGSDTHDSLCVEINNTYVIYPYVLEHRLFRRCLKERNLPFRYVTSTSVGKNMKRTCLSLSKTCTRAVCKVRGLTFLLRVGTLWRCGDGLFFEVPPLASDALLNNAPPTSRKRAADRWSLWNFLPRSSLFMIGKVHKSHGARSELNSLFGFEKVDRWNPIKTSAIQFLFRPMQFLGFTKHEKGAPKQEISKLSTVCRTFSRSGWSVIRSSSLAKGGTSKNRPLPHL
jgi:hypothetical protein